jgi:uncharacterized protein (TIGR02599 family)
MKISFPSPHCRASTGFTLVEVLVSSVLVVAIMVLLLGTVDQTQRLWQRSRSKTTQFQSARAAFEAMSRRVAQATLNTYWKAHEENITSETSDFKFRRQGEMQFVSGPAARFFNATPKINNLNPPVAENYPTHAVFFSAPLGYTEYVDPASTVPDLKKFRSLDSAMTACGYFIEFGDDPSVPSFLSNMNPPPPPRYRYRLMEMTLPTEKYSLYSRPVAASKDGWSTDARVYDESGTAYYDGMLVKGSREPKASFTRPLWMKEAFVRKKYGSGTTEAYRFQYAHPLAENIVALIVLPKLATRDRVNVGTTTPNPDVLELAPKYEYDSWRVLVGGDATDPNHPGVTLDNRARDNLLPPIVQLTMVAIDEPSTLRMDLKLSGKPDWANNIFKQADKETKHLDNIAQLEAAIRDDPKNKGINYRIFTTDVIIRGSKWSRDPRNP